jgi:hypothetical protein
MNNVLVAKNIMRGLILLLFQVLVLQRINLGGAEFNYITIFLYPIFLMFLPLNTPTWLALIVAFAYGYIIDNFGGVMGMHTATCVFSAFLRSLYLRILEPQGGYKEGSSPTRRRMGFIWFLRYSSLFMFTHIFIFFFVEAFTPLYMVRILMHTVPSFIISMVFILIYSFLLESAD